MNLPPAATEPSRWTRLAERVVATTRVLELRSVRCRHPQRGTERDFVVVHTPDWVNVVALTTDRQLVIVRQFRFGLDGFSLEVPGGVIEAGEDPVAAGVRELAEETGFAGGTARLLGSVHPNPAIQDNRCHIVLVEGVARTQALAWDADEEIAISTAPVDDVLAWTRDGRIGHSLTLCALLLFEPRWAELRSRPAV
ncbi:MAG: NUDIX hydrolase [Opitutae bacterium]|nr:NUDIX hydrolase [Opitutae bacterium]